MRSDVEIINQEKTWIFDHAPIGVLVELLTERCIKIPLDKIEDRSYLIFIAENGFEHYVREATPTDTFRYYAPAYITSMYDRWKVKDWKKYE